MENPSAGKTALGLDTNVGALLCYLPVCGISLIYSIIVIVTDKVNAGMRFHAFQSLLISVLATVVFIAIAVVGGILIGVSGSGIIGGLVTLLYIAALIGFLGAMIMGMVKGFGGEKFKFPIVGDMAEKWANG